MLNRFIAASLRSRVLVLAASLLVAFYGGWVALRMPIDVLPDLNRPTVTVMTEAHGMVPEDVERLITVPLEQLLNGSTGVTRVRSSSGRELSVVHVEFDWGTEIFRNRQIVQEKLQLAQGAFPPGVQPQMAPISSIMGQIQMIGVQSRSGKTDSTALRSISDIQIKPRLRALPGVAQVVTSGGAPRQLQITVDADKMRTFDVTLEEIGEAIHGANVNTTGGMLDIGWKGPLVTYTGRVEDPLDLEEAVVRADPVRPVRLREVAKVEFGPATILTGQSGVNGTPGVTLVVFKQPAVDTVALTRAVNTELARIQPTLSDDVVLVNNLFQQSAFIERAVDNVEDAVRDGAILVVVILFIFLLNFRTTFITLTAIPLSVAVTAIVFQAFGLGINTMTLGGLAVAIGALVDDAIVGVENVFRRLRQNSQSPEPKPLLWIIFKASSEVRNPILIGTLLVVVVYLPLFSLTGMEGRLFTPIGLAYIISTLASLLVSLTLTPVLCYYLLGEKLARSHAGDGFVVRALKRVAAKTIRFGLAFPMPIAGVLLACVLAGLLVLGTRGSQFLPAFNEGSAQISLILPPDTSLRVSDEYGRRMEALIMQVAGVKNVGRRTGRAEGDEHAEGVNVTEAIVTFDPSSKRPREEVIEEIRDRLSFEFPGVATSVEQPLAHLLSSLLSGVNAQVAVKIYGPDLDVLRKAAEEAEATIRPIAGVRDLYVEAQVLVDQVEVKPDREQLARAGLTVESVAETIELAMAGESVSRLMVGQVAYPIIVRLDEKDRRNLAAIGNISLRASDGSQIRLGDVADVRLAKTPNNINRENASRRIVVQHNVGGRSLGEVVADVDRALEPLRKELAGQSGYSIQISGQFDAQAEATRLISILSIVSLAAMCLILFIHFRSVSLTLQVLASIPMAFVGAVLYIILSDQVMSVATLVGLISLAGIATRNAILLLDHYIHLMHEEGEPFSKEMIVRAGQERMVPVLMTALCSGIALVPLALDADKPGRELLFPVATVIIGGLISSTLLEFLVRPGLFWTFARNAAERLAAYHEAQADTMEEFEKEFTEKPAAPPDPGPPSPSEGIAHA
ncbi:MAG: efflux RND transporter permease subunit [Planctomycetes bacterium]|nr:efflux RND transporter permease subunit [Planctomycetota bacterium]